MIKEKRSARYQVAIYGPVSDVDRSHTKLPLITPRAPYIVARPDGMSTRFGVARWKHKLLATTQVEERAASERYLMTWPGDLFAREVLSGAVSTRKVIGSPSTSPLEVLTQPKPSERPRKCRDANDKVVPHTAELSFQPDTDKRRS